MSELNDKSIIITGIKPSGEIHLGTICGCIKPLAELQKEYENINVFIADIHALTKPIEAKKLNLYTKQLLLTYLSYLSWDNLTIFRQSRVPAHSQLSQILTCFANVNDLLKMPQYKDFVSKFNSKEVPAGILDYPNWMNADILLYSQDDKELLVPCGTDQLSHIYFCRDIADKVNKITDQNIFTKVTPIINTEGHKIMSLKDPSKKMSKSESDAGTVYLFDTAEVIYDKFLKAKTDCENKVYYDAVNKPGISNLINIYSIFSGLSYDEIEAKYAHITNYKEFKLDIAYLVSSEFEVIKEAMHNLETQDKEQVKQLLESGEIKARKLTNKKLQEVYNKLGLGSEII